MSDFWKNKKVFVTGHTGFKGGWLCTWLLQAGAVVKGYALEPEQKESFYSSLQLAKKMTSVIGDINSYPELLGEMTSFAPEIVFHLAAQPLVRKSYREPLGTYMTNVMGTAHVLESCRNISGLRSVVVVTTDKCYENKEWSWAYRENEPLGGYDPYSSSKACAELVTAAYRQSFFNIKDYAKHQVGIASVRAGNVIGGGDWSEDRLIPDAIRSLLAREPLKIRSPRSVRPWQHVLEPVAGYLKIAEKLYSQGDIFSQAYNFGSREEDCLSVQEVLDVFARSWGPEFKWIDESSAHNPHEAGLLKLDSSKAKSLLQWQPHWNVNTAIAKTVEWYKAYGTQPASAWDTTVSQIRAYNS